LQAVDDTEQTAFSDDDLPGGVDMADPFFSQELTDTQKSKTKKKKKGIIKSTYIKTLSA